MIRHTVAFRLAHTRDSTEERAFLNDALVLAGIPGVQRFERLVQTSPKNDFEFGFSMEFASPADYQSYNEHPIHTDFVEGRWIPEVEDFLEADFVVLDDHEPHIH